MTSGFDIFLAASNEERRDTFLGASRRLATAAQNIEKDFWVCWTLDALFNRLPEASPRLLFKGGTSLSKAFGLIFRFSEDIDVTVFRDDIGAGAGVEALEAMSGKKRQAKLDAIKAACQAYIAGPLQARLAVLLAASLDRAGIADPNVRVELDPDDPDRQSLLLWYPNLTGATGGYIRPAVKIESGAKSALDPHRIITLTPYVQSDVQGVDLSAANITVVDAERTFWDKIIILHGLRCWFDRRGVLRGGGQRVSRHYYDVYRLLKADLGKAALNDTALGLDCARHARMFFNSTDLNLGSAKPGTFSLLPSNAMMIELKRDYEAMSGMIFGDVPAFQAVIESVAMLEARVNREGQIPPVGPSWPVKKE